MSKNMKFSGNDHRYMKLKVKKREKEQKKGLGC